MNDGTPTRDGLEVPEAAVEAVEAAWDAGNASGLDGWVGPGRGTLPVDDQAVWDRERDVRAALPHIRRAVIEELAEKAEARMKALQEHRIIDGTPEADEWEAVARTWGWLRAELEGDGE